MSAQGEGFNIGRVARRAFLQGLTARPNIPLQSAAGTDAAPVVMNTGPQDALILEALERGTRKAKGIACGSRIEPPGWCKRRHHGMKRDAPLLKESSSLVKQQDQPNRLFPQALGYSVAEPK
jgi:hypothetical protein